MLEHRFTGKADLNRHYFAAEIYCELGKLEGAKKHIDLCAERLAQAAKPKLIEQLRERIDLARRARLKDNSR